MLPVLKMARSLDVYPNGPILFGVFLRTSGHLGQREHAFFASSIPGRKRSENLQTNLGLERVVCRVRLTSFNPSLTFRLNKHQQTSFKRFDTQTK